jgi:alpha-ketoglutarate-dependent taurine dioxygenase
MQEGNVPTLSLSSVRRRTIRSSDEFVTIRPLYGDGAPPLLVECLLEHQDLAAWSANNLLLITDGLRKHGGILFRGFSSGTEQGLRRFTDSIGMKIMHYMEGATPRKALGNNIYTSTEFPPEHTIALHNENSYVMTWPMKICFACVIVPRDRGETPIADVRRVLHRIDSSVLRRFEVKGYMLVRNFSEHLSLPWRTSFKVSTRQELASYCEKAGLQLEWLDDEHLRTRQVRPVVTTHPVTGERVWFNHVAFWHVSSLEKNIREILTSTYSEEGIPYNTYYGDGTRIEDDVVEHLRKAYHAETVKFPWREGDVLLLDNMLVAHGRSPFSGPRKIVVSMGEPHTRTDM